MPLPKDRTSLLLASALLLIAASAVLISVLAVQPVAAEPMDAMELSSADAVSDGMPFHPLSLELSMTVVIDMSLMTLGLVILFKDDGLERYQAR